MGDVLPFIARMRASGDWTPVERAHLEDLARAFADQALGVEAVFGVTEEGDPWCAVKDANEDVLVHVARIGGRFVIHYADEDVVEEGADLYEALSQHLGEADAPADNVVNGHFGFNRHAQILAALLIAAAFFYDADNAKAAEAHPVEAPPQPSPEAAITPPTPPAKEVGSRQDRDVAAHGAALIDPAAQPAPVISAPHHDIAAQPAAPPAEHIALPQPPPVEHVALPAPAAAAVALALAAATPAINIITGTSGDDHLVGTAGADHIMGGDGADLLAGGGAPAGQFDILDGGAGNDTLIVDAQTVAIGGAGADTFVIAAPEHPVQAPTQGATAPAPAHTPDQTFLGVIADFNAPEGDRVVNARGQTVQLRQHIEATAAAAADGDAPQTAAASDVMTVFGFTGHRVDVDLNGDGKIDGYVVMGGHLPPDLLGASVLAAHETLVSLLGQPPAAANDMS